MKKTDLWGGPTEKQNAGTYPTMTDVKNAVIKEIGECTKQHHPRMPKNIIDAAGWFMGLCDKPSQGEAPMAKNSGTGQFWIWPYLARVRFQINCFMHTTRDHQDMIIDCAAEGVFWRGETKTQLMTVYGEFEKMREIGVAAYRAKIQGLLPKGKTWGSDADKRRYASLSRAEHEAEE